MKPGRGFCPVGLGGGGGKMSEWTWRQTATVFLVGFWLGILVSFSSQRIDPIILPWVFFVLTNIVFLAVFWSFFIRPEMASGSSGMAKNE